MEPAVQPKTIVQLSEQVFNPVKIPIIINNEIYLMVQQDVRHIEETRHISYVKIGQDEQFLPFDGTTLNQPQGTVAKIPQTISLPPPPQCKTKSFVENVINCTRNNFYSTPGFPFHYSEGTSTSDLTASSKCCRDLSNCARSPVETSNKSCLVREVTCRGINTDILISRNEDECSCEEELNALVKLKLRKINDSSSA